MPNLTTKPRIEYIDIIKGLCIFWVIWFHLPTWSIVRYPIRMPLFFFISGIFFKIYPPKEFFYKKINTLVVPFFFFYVATYLYKVGVYFFFSSFSPNGEQTAFDFGSIFSIFHIFETGEIKLNIPLWFIVVLLIFQTILYAIARLIKFTAMRISACCAASVFLIWLSTSPSTIPGNLWLFIFYSSGFIFGKRLISYIENRQLKELAGFLIINIAVWIIADKLTGYAIYEYQSKALSYIAYFALIFIIIVGFKYLSSFLPLNKLIFWGKNSYILLGLHGCFLDLWSTVYTVVIHQPISEIPALFVLTATILSFYPLILLLNRYCPVLVGKKDLIKYKTAGREERPAVTTAAE